MLELALHHLAEAVAELVTRAAAARALGPSCAARGRLLLAWLLHSGLLPHAWLLLAALALMAEGALALREIATLRAILARPRSLTWLLLLMRLLLLERLLHHLRGRSHRWLLLLLLGVHWRLPRSLELGLSAHGLLLLFLGVVRARRVEESAVRALASSRVGRKFALGLASSAKSATASAVTAAAAPPTASSATATSAAALASLLEILRLGGSLTEVGLRGLGRLR